MGFLWMGLVMLRHMPLRFVLCSLIGGFGVSVRGGLRELGEWLGGVCELSRCGGAGVRKRSEEALGEG